MHTFWIMQYILTSILMGIAGAEDAYKDGYGTSTAVFVFILTALIWPAWAIRNYIF